MKNIFWSLLLSWSVLLIYYDFPRDCPNLSHNDEKVVDFFIYSSKKQSSSRLAKLVRPSNIRFFFLLQDYVIKFRDFPATIKTRSVLGTNNYVFFFLDSIYEFCYPNRSEKKLCIIVVCQILFKPIRCVEDLKILWSFQIIHCAIIWEQGHSISFIKLAKIVDIEFTNWKTSRAQLGS